MSSKDYDRMMREIVNPPRHLDPYNTDFIEFLENNDYSMPKFVKDRGWCAIHRSMFTVDIVWGLDETGFKGKWMFPNAGAAISAFLSWEDTQMAPGIEWIKYKGEGGEYSNPPSKYDDSSQYYDNFL